MSNMVSNMVQLTACIEVSLERAAELVGDITPATLEKFYDKFPDARAAFARHSRYRPQLEGDMVQEALYCLMSWFESRNELSIMLNDSVVHHKETLLVRHEWYAGLLEAAAGVIVETIPATQEEELAAWRQLSRELHETIERSSRSSMPRPRVEQSAGH